MHAVGIIFEDKDKNILVLKRHHSSLEGNTWGLVGGQIDDGEDKISAAVRETSEEIGHIIPAKDLQFIKTYYWQRPNGEVRFEVFKYRSHKKMFILN